MNNLQMFKSEEFGVLRGGLINDEFWFIGKDVVGILGYNLRTSYTNYIRRYCSEKDIINYNKETQFNFDINLNYKELSQRGGLLVNEYALHDLTINSSLPNIRAFKEWIVEEVLPQIKQVDDASEQYEEPISSEIISSDKPVINEEIVSCEEPVGDVQTISSREVAEMMETRHDNLMNKIEKHTVILEKVTDLKIKVSDLWQLSSYKDNTGRILKEYQVTKKGCEFLAHKTTGEKGDLFTIRYMNKFEEMEQYIKEQEPKMPTTYKEALKHLLLQVEENEKLQLENKEQQKTIGEMSPKAKYFDDLVDRDLLLNFRDTAKELGIKQRDFIEFLINSKYIYRDSGGNLRPYSTSMSKGLFKIKEFVINNHAGTQTLITPKGREYFNKKIKNIS